MKLITNLYQYVAMVRVMFYGMSSASFSRSCPFGEPAFSKDAIHTHYHNSNLIWRTVLIPKNCGNVCHNVTFLDTAKAGNRRWPHFKG